MPATSPPTSEAARGRRRIGRCPSIASVRMPVVRRRRNSAVYMGCKTTPLSRTSPDAADIAGLFALEWCRRHHWFFDLYVGQGDAKYTFGKADHDAYAEGDAFCRVVGLLHPEDPGAQRALKMRKLVPWGPRW